MYLSFGFFRDLHCIRAEARKKELRYKIANKNHLVPDITTNSAMEKAYKKLATQGGIVLSSCATIGALHQLIRLNNPRSARMGTTRATSPQPVWNPQSYHLFMFTHFL